MEFIWILCPKDESFDLNKSEEEQKKMLDYFFEEPSEKEWNKYVSFENYCKTIQTKDVFFQCMNIVNLEMI